MKTLLTFFILALSAVCLRAQNIYTVAGGNTGNGRPATFFGICADGVAADASGNVYIADACNSVVYKVSDGILTVAAGNGTGNYSGDGGPATAAALWEPEGVAVDGAGNLYIADYGNNVVRKVNTAGAISTIAGNGTAGYSGDGGLAGAGELNQPFGIAADATGNLFIADGNNNVIREVNTAGIINTIAGNNAAGYSGDEGPATSAELSYPSGIALDGASNIYIADYSNNRIRKVNTAGIISTVAGNGVQGYTIDTGKDSIATNAELNFPIGVAVDNSGNLFIADGNNNVISKVNTRGIISKVAGNDTVGFRGDGGPDTLAELNYPGKIAFDASGNLYIADQYNFRVREINPFGIIITLAGDGSTTFGDGLKAVKAELQYPSGVVPDISGNLYITDANNNRIRMVNTAGIITTIAGTGAYGYSGDGGPATAAELYYPVGLAFDNSGNLFIADQSNNAIRKVNAAGIISTVAGDGTQGYSGDGGTALSAQLNYPQLALPDDSGNLYIADGSNNVIRKVNSSGIISTVAGNGIDGYSGDREDATAAELFFPTGIALDDTGNLYIADASNNRIRKVNTAGVISTVAGDGTAGYSGDGGSALSAKLNLPVGVALDDSGNLFIADYYNNVIRKMNLQSTIISTVAGNDTAGFSGDGGIATAGELNGPASVVRDNSGNIFIADQNNNRVREVTKGSPLIINELRNNMDVTIYPVPGSGQLTVQIENGGLPIVNSTLSIYNMLGNVVYTQPVNAVQNNLSLNLASGIYILQVVTSQGVVSKRIEVIKN